METLTESGTLFLLAADAVLLLHALFVLFVISGLVLVLVGKALNWSWVRNWWFRVSHLVAICVVVAQAWLGVICPLTTLEMWLRRQAGEASYAGTFISHWLESILYYRAPAWVFAVGYTVFAALVVLSWAWVRPNRRN
jgi:multisubunit Na+/H+ antiporter MnhB subunit